MIWIKLITCMHIHIYMYYSIFIWDGALVFVFWQGARRRLRLCPQICEYGSTSGNHVTSPVYILHITYYILHITYYIFYILHITYYILHITYYILHIYT